MLSAGLIAICLVVMLVPAIGTWAFGWKGALLCVAVEALVVAILLWPWHQGPNNLAANPNTYALTTSDIAGAIAAFIGVPTFIGLGIGSGLRWLRMREVTGS